MKTLYLECFSGISGDMAVGALLDLGGDSEYLINALNSLNIDGYEIKIYQTSKCGIGATKFDVILNEHDHHSHTHEHGKDHNHEKKHSHDHNHHVHRNIKDILNIINNSKITDRAKQLATKMFNIVAQAESKCHRIPVEDVHFHEVGAVDSIIDIISVAVLIDYLKIDKVITGVINEGTGSVRCQHGIIPVPSPATSQIAAEYNIPLNITDINGEMVTPTGAAIVACLTDSFEKPKNMQINKIGIGAGTKDFEHANILRAYLINNINSSTNDSIIKIEANIDDSTGEHLGYAMELLLNIGAKDVYFSPIYMKKNRPAVMLSVLTVKEKFDEVIEILFKHTSTIGIRYYNVNRIKMKRKIKNIDTKYGEISVKKTKYKDIKKITLEFESARKAAIEHNVSISEIEKEVIRNK